MSLVFFWRDCVCVIFNNEHFMLKLDTIWTRRKAIADERLKICGECEHFNPQSTKCRKCGCFMNYKAMLPYVDCPIGKWGIINTVESDTQELNEWKS